MTETHAPGVDPAGWRPIDSAPTDGSVIDLWVRHCHGEYEGRCADMAWGDGAWCDCEYGDELEEVLIPTHWMPRPAPPLPTPGGSDDR